MLLAHPRTATTTKGKISGRPNANKATYAVVIEENLA